MQKISQIGVLLSYYSHCWYNINVVFVLSFLFQVAGIQRVEMEKTFLALYINTCWIVWFHVVVMLNLYCCWICNSVLLLEFKELRCSRDKTFPAPLKLKIVENSGNWCHLHWCPHWCHAHCCPHWCPHWCHPHWCRLPIHIPNSSSRESSEIRNLHSMKIKNLKQNDNVKFDWRLRDWL